MLAGIVVDMGNSVITALARAYERQLLLSSEVPNSLKLERIPAQAGILDLLWSTGQARHIHFQFWETAVFL
jgi:hypothetical protein